MCLNNQAELSLGLGPVGAGAGTRCWDTQNKHSEAAGNDPGGHVVLNPESYQLAPHRQETGQSLERRYGHNDDIKIFSITFELNTLSTKIPAEFAVLRICQNDCKVHRMSEKF